MQSRSPASGTDRENVEQPLEIEPAISQMSRNVSTSRVSVIPLPPLPCVSNCNVAACEWFTDLFSAARGLSLVARALQVVWVGFILTESLGWDRRESKLQKGLLLSDSVSDESPLSNATPVHRTQGH